MKRIASALLLLSLMISCGKQELTIKKHQLGDIDKNTTIEALEARFSQDSLVRQPEEGERVRELQVYDKKGELSLVFATKIENDSVKGIELIKIYDPIYNTESGVSTASNFKEISEKYTISKVEPSFSYAVLYIDELNATISLNKKDLKIDEFDMREIKLEQIPELASVKYITLWLE